MSSENVLTPYEKVLAARKSDRPDIMKYIEVLFDDFIEMHGDRSVSYTHLTLPTT